MRDQLFHQQNEDKSCLLHGVIVKPKCNYMLKALTLWTIWADNSLFCSVDV